MTKDTYRTPNRIIHWAAQYLLSQGDHLKSSLPEIIQDTPWSYVARFATSAGYIYLKNTPKLLALEAKIIQILDTQFQARVPKIIAHNAQLNAFLMADAGTSLRVILKQKFDADLLCKAADQFTSLQISVADHVDTLLDIGVPDWRLDQLPDLYIELLSQHSLLLEDGLSEVEISQLKALTPTIKHLCKNLSSYAIKQTIVQPDFNDNNALLDKISQEITFIDLGEIVISHPFFSLINFLYVIKKHHALKNSDVAYLKIKRACLKNFMHHASKESLLDAFAIAKILFFVYGALGHYRLMLACDKARFTALFQGHGRPSVPLKELIKHLR